MIKVMKIQSSPSFNLKEYYGSECLKTHRELKLNISLGNHVISVRFRVCYGNGQV